MGTKIKMNFNHLFKDYVHEKWLSKRLGVEFFVLINYVFCTFIMIKGTTYFIEPFIEMIKI